jgi:hypothetical protein
LAAAKARGVRLGNPQLPTGTAQTAAVARQGRVAKANAHAADLRDVVEAARGEGCTTLQQLADHMNDLSCPTPRGAAWTPAAASRLLVRLGMHRPVQRAAQRAA